MRPSLLPSRFSARVTTRSDLCVSRTATTWKSGASAVTPNKPQHFSLWP